MQVSICTFMPPYSGLIARLGHWEKFLKNLYTCIMISNTLLLL